MKSAGASHSIAPVALRPCAWPWSAAPSHVTISIRVARAGGRSVPVPECLVGSTTADRVRRRPGHNRTHSVSPRKRSYGRRASRKAERHKGSKKCKGFMQRGKYTLEVVVSPVAPEDLPHLSVPFFAKNSRHSHLKRDTLTVALLGGMISNRISALEAISDRQAVNAVNPEYWRTRILCGEANEYINARGCQHMPRGRYPR